MLPTKENARRQPGAESQLANYGKQLDSQPTAGLQEIFSWLPLPGGRALRWLLDQGVPFHSLNAVKGAWVKFDGTIFDFDADGERVLILRCDDRGETIDLAAWSARGDKLATWRSSAFCLGDVDQCFNPATWFAGGGLRVHRGPLEWLCADRDGIVILRPAFCWGHLRHVPRVICADTMQAEWVKRQMRPPKILTELFVEANVAEEIAA